MLVAALEEALQTPPAAPVEAAAEATPTEEQIENVQTVSAEGVLQDDAVRASIAAALAEAEAEAEPEQPQTAATATIIAAVQKVPYTGLRPVARPAKMALAGTSPDPEPVVVTRLSTSGGHYWGINVGLYTSRYQAEKVLLRTALSELEDTGRQLAQGGQDPQRFRGEFPRHVSGARRAGMPPPERPQRDMQADWPVLSLRHITQNRRRPAAPFFSLYPPETVQALPPVARLFCEKASSRWAWHLQGRERFG